MKNLRVNIELHFLIELTSGKFFNQYICSPGSRYVRIYNSEGVLQATNEPLEGLEQCIGWRFDHSFF